MGKLSVHPWMYSISLIDKNDKAKYAVALGHDNTCYLELDVLEEISKIKKAKDKSTSVLICISTVILKAYEEGVLAGKLSEQKYKETNNEERIFNTL
jgi:hypothetical protein